MILQNSREIKVPKKPILTPKKCFSDETYIFDLENNLFELYKATYYAIIEIKLKLNQTVDSCQNKF